MPDENIAPSPRRTRTRTESSAAAASIAAPSSRIVSPLSALRFSGRLMTRCRTPPLSSVITRATPGLSMKVQRKRRGAG